MDRNNSQSLADMSVDELTQGYATGSISPLEVTKDCLSRIEAFNPEVNAFCLIDADGALKSAKASEKRWQDNTPLSAIDGIPTTSKDTTSVKGWVSTAGSRVFDMASPAQEDSSFVSCLKKAGAVLLGLTNSPEIGWKGVTDSLRHGITRNPWNTNLTPGGSSGGAVVAAALGMGCLHVGTDAGGSIRIPASFTGVFGHKPSFGRVPNYPPSAFSTMSHAGPITRTVKDAAHMLSVLARPDVNDWNALPYQPEDYANICSKGISDLKIAFSPNPAGHAVDAEVVSRVKHAADIFKNLGATVEDRDFDYSGCEEIFNAYWHGAVAWRLRELTDEQLSMLDPGLLKVFSASQQNSLIDFLNANQQRIQLGARANAFHQEFDLLITPTLPIVAFTAGQNVPDDSSYKSWSDWAAFCYPINLTRQPACSVPCGFTKAGLPVGLQLIGRQFDDATVLRAAAAFEAVYPAVMPVKPVKKG
jgi:aspartyl-tRNA(Asn)/glutamyl-tRNA(Gln) amidotransferase subunit A